MAKAGNTGKSKDLPRVVKMGCTDDARKVDRFLASHEHEPRSRARFRVRIKKSGLKSLNVHTVDPLLTG